MDFTDRPRAMLLGDIFGTIWRFFFIFLKQNRKNVQAFAVPQKIWKL
jgi:hypothetical protein